VVAAAGESLGVLTSLAGVSACSRPRRERAALQTILRV
jgi:hypothetical protein